MRLALEALVELVEKFDYEQYTSICELDPAKNTIFILQEALAEQAEQEPVASFEEYLCSRCCQPTMYPGGKCYKCSQKYQRTKFCEYPKCGCKKDKQCKPEKQCVIQEPVAWALSHSLGIEFSSKYPMQATKEAAEQMAREHMGAVVVTPLYAAPVRTKDLTDDEVAKAYMECTGGDIIARCRAVIALDREKNK